MVALPSARASFHRMKFSGLQKVCSAGTYVLGEIAANRNYRTEGPHDSEVQLTVNEFVLPVGAKQRLMSRSI